MNLEEHPTVQRVRARERSESPPTASTPLNADWLRRLALEAGADDAGVVGIDRSEIDDQRGDILRYAPQTKALISFACRMNRQPIRSPARSIANLEFHHSGDEVNEVGRRIVAKLEAAGIRAINPSMGFPMEMHHFPDKIWVVSHKPVAVAAGLGQIGIHRNLIHPRYGNFVLLGTILVETEVESEDRPIDYNPCLECKLCVAACPVGAISPDGYFNFSACYTHNYREFMGGFTDWVEQTVTSKNASDYRRRVPDNESASMWQSLSFGANYKAAYCLAVCPAGEDVIEPYLNDKKEHRSETVRPLQAREETVYVLPGSDAEAHVAKRFPHKEVKRVSNSLRPRTIAGFLDGLPLVFQPGRSEGLNVTYHFTFTGAEERRATIEIRDGKLRVMTDHVGTPDLRVQADSMTWLGFLARERSLVWALLRRRIRLKGSPRLLVAFGNCFPA